MKKIISIFIFLILIINVYAEVDKDIFYFDEIDLDIELKSSVFLVPKSDDHETEYVSINLKFLPTTDSRQNVISIETNPKADIDEKGGTAISISHVTDKPILYLGTGQELKDIEKFNVSKLIENLGW